MAKMNFIAVDMGASSGRCALGTFDGEKLSLEIANRFPNGPIEACGHWYWDALNLYQGVKEGLARIARQQRGNIASIGVDSWGVDFALLDREGKLTSNPYCARDPQTREIYPAVIYPRIRREKLFASTGIQFMEINSLCQLAAMQARQDPAYLSASTFLHIADLMNYWLSGVKACEYTNASTSQMLDVNSHRGRNRPYQGSVDRDGYSRHRCGGYRRTGKR
jgi:rhamnulokinase